MWGLTRLGVWISGLESQPDKPNTEILSQIRAQNDGLWKAQNEGAGEAQDGGLWEVTSARERLAEESNPMVALRT